jgi:hypothetical protein
VRGRALASEETGGAQHQRTGADGRDVPRAACQAPELREQFLPRIQAWKQVVLEAVRDALRTHKPSIPTAFSAEAIASLISEFWLGMEFARLIGGSDEKARHEQALDAVESMLVSLEARPATSSQARKVKSRRTGMQRRQ